MLNHRQHLVLRLGLLFGPSINGRPSFFQQQIQAMGDGTPCDLFEDEWRTPLALQVAARGILLAATSEVSGILHLGGAERISRLDMGRRLARARGQDERLCRAASRADVTSAEPRPRDTSLCSDLWDRTFRGFERPGYEDSLRHGTGLNLQATSGLIHGGVMWHRGSMAASCWRAPSLTPVAERSRRRSVRRRPRQFTLRSESPVAANDR